MELTGPERNCRCMWVLLLLGILPISCPSIGVDIGLEMLWGLGWHMGWTDYDYVLVCFSLQL